MKKTFEIVTIALMIPALMAACSSDTMDAAHKIRWYSMGEGLVAAGESDKKVFLYFRADW